MYVQDMTNQCKNRFKLPYLFVFMQNLGVFKHLKMMPLNPTDKNKIKHVRKFDTKTLTPKN